MKEELQVYEDKMEKTLASLLDDFGSIRAGRANPAVLNKITVDYYGTMTPVPQVGTVSVPEPRMLMIQPWDASMIKEIERAIQASDLGLNPTNDGKAIRIAFPSLTEERRKELTKSVSKREEEAKVAIRNIRRDMMERFKAQKKDGEITEDDLKGYEKDVQNVTDKFIKEIEEITKEKNQELMEV